MKNIKTVVEGCSSGNFSNCTNDDNLCTNFKTRMCTTNNLLCNIYQIKVTKNEEIVKMTSYEEIRKVIFITVT